MSWIGFAYLVCNFKALVCSLESCKRGWLGIVFRMQHLEIFRFKKKTERDKFPILMACTFGLGWVPEEFYEGSVGAFSFPLLRG